MKKNLTNIGNTINVPSNNTKYAKILETYTHNYRNVNTDDGKYAKIKLYTVGQASYVEKEYLILNPYSSSNPFRVYDLNPKENRIELFYTFIDETYSFYVKSNFVGYFIVCDLEYSDTPGCFKGYQYANFNIDKDDSVAIVPTIYSISFNPTFNNEWTNSNSSCKYYQHNKSVSLELTAKNGIITDGTILCSIPSEYAPLNTIYVPVYYWTGNQNQIRENGFCKIESSGDVTLYHTVANSNLLAIKTTYTL